jgi:hypothetical protein
MPPVGVEQNRVRSTEDVESGLAIWSLAQELKQKQRVRAVMHKTCQAQGSERTRGESGEGVKE